MRDMKDWIAPLSAVQAAAIPNAAMTAIPVIPTGLLMVSPSGPGSQPPGPASAIRKAGAREGGLIAAERATSGRLVTL